MSGAPPGPPDGTGLRAHVRDRELPARRGEPDLCPPEDAEVRRLVQRHLVGDGGPEVRSARWDYARWKPGVSVTSAHAVELADGSRVTVACKRYRGDKVRHLAERAPDAPASVREGWTADRHELPDQGLALWTPEGDRALGLAPLLSSRRVASVFREHGLLDPDLVRKRRTTFHLLRYKPERRAVLRLDLVLRDAARSRHSLAYRVLPKDGAARLIVRRRALEAAGGSDLAPPLAGAHGPYGLLAEPWLDLRPPATPDGPDGARAVGGLLARLHALPVPDALPRHRPAPLDRLAGLLGGPRWTDLSWPAPATPVTWIHGDLHPDQWAHGPAGPLLLDLDALAVGDPALDLASWVADALVAREDQGLEAAAAPLLEAYASAGGRPPGSPHLARLVACELVRRAAGQVRRLQQGALERAALLVERARALAAPS